MADGILRRESPTEYFRELVEAALRRQRIAAGELTSFYLVNLLAGFVHRERSPAAADEPLGVRLAKALQEAGSRQRDGLREVGDVSLFISGFFSDSLNRRLVDVDYYIQLGERAYGSLARQGDPALSDVFDELAAKFPAFVDVLSEISERSALTSNSDLLRLYEKWMRTGSRRTGDLLASRGIVPNQQLGRIPLHPVTGMDRRHPSPDELADEAHRVRRVRHIVDVAANLIMQARLSRVEAEGLVAIVRERVLQLFPGCDETFEVIYSQRFKRLIDEFALPAERPRGSVVPLPTVRG